MSILAMCCNYIKLPLLPLKFYQRLQEHEIRIYEYSRNFIPEPRNKDYGLIVCKPVELYASTPKNKNYYKRFFSFFVFHISVNGVYDQPRSQALIYDESLARQHF